jgi:hypothetical protein
MTRTSRPEIRIGLAFRTWWQRNTIASEPNRRPPEVVRKAYGDGYQDGWAAAVASILRSAKAHGGDA